MQVQNWMTPNVVSVDPDTSVVRVSQILRENNFRHIPVTREGQLVGLIADEDVKAASPSTTTLTANELYHLLAEMKAKHIMKADPPTVRPEQTIEVAALKMLDHRVTGIPVVRVNGELVGIITQGDIFKALISITGIHQGGVQLAFNLEDRGGSIKEVADVIREFDGRIVSILSTRDTADEGFRHVFIRIQRTSPENLQNMVQKLKQNFMILYVTEDPSREVSEARRKDGGGEKEAP